MLTADQENKTATKKKGVQHKSGIELLAQRLLSLLLEPRNGQIEVYSAGEVGGGGGGLLTQESHSDSGVTQ